MNNLLEKNTISEKLSVFNALEKLNHLGSKSILTLFVVNENNELVGTLTDGDIRRSLLNGCELDTYINTIMRKEFRFLSPGKININNLKEFRRLEIELVPILDENRKIIEVVNLAEQKSILPVDAIIMAGGEGKRLNPHTLTVPKPLLEVGGKPIVQYNVERLVEYGISNISISVNYLKQQIIDYFKSGEDFNARIKYLHEESKLGTIGSSTLVEEYYNDYVLVMNSDLLTNIDFEDFFLDFIENDADMAVATIPYKVNIPYAILNTEANVVKSFKEKPSMTYYSNAGIYLMKKSVLDLVPSGEFYDATDLMNKVINDGMKLISYPILGYWLDIGKPEDFEKAKEDVKHIKL